MSAHGGRAQVTKLEPRPVVTPTGRSPFVATPIWVHERGDAGEITRTDLHIYGTIARHAHNVTRYARLFQDTIAREAGVSLITVSRSIRRLVDASCLTAERAGKRRRDQANPNRYHLPWNDPRLSTGESSDTSPMTHQPKPAPSATSPMTYLRPSDTSPMTYITRGKEELDGGTSVTAQRSGHAREEIQPPLMSAQPEVQSDALTRGSPPTPAPPPDPDR